jgi:hypothetical protein
MPANGPITFKTLNTSIRYGKQRFSSKGIDVKMRETRRYRLFPRGKEFDLEAPFKARLSVSKKGLISIEDVMSFAASPQIADWLAEMKPGGRQGGHIRIGTKRDYSMYIFFIQKEKDQSWSVSLFETDLELDVSRLDNETAAMLTSVKEVSDKRFAQLDNKMGTELARLHGVARDLVQIRNFADLDAV